MASNQAGWVGAEVGRQPWIVHPPVEWNEDGSDLVVGADGLYEYEEREGLRTVQCGESRGQCPGSRHLSDSVHDSLPQPGRGLDHGARPQDPPGSGEDRGSRRGDGAWLSGCLVRAAARPAQPVLAWERGREMSYELLCIIWFILLNVLLIGYAILDGFDLGVGFLHPFVAKDDTERRLVMNSIGPLWDGNEVWLVTFGGALFAMFPEAYASIFSTFYLPFVLLLFALIFRAVSLEFRSKRTSPAWRSFWDILFFVGSTLAALLFGVAVGALMQGVAISERGDFLGSMLDLVSGFSLAVGLFTVALLAMHGSIYLYMKTEGALQQRLYGWMKGTWYVYVFFFMVVTIWSTMFVPASLQHFRDTPVLWVVPLINVLAIANIMRAIRQERPFYAFISSCLVIAALVILFSANLFPNLVPAVNNAAYNITIINGASSRLTLTIGLIIVAIGMPLVLSYTSLIYWTFRGKVTLGPDSY